MVTNKSDANLKLVSHRMPFACDNCGSTGVGDFGLPPVGATIAYIAPCHKCQPEQEDFCFYWCNDAGMLIEQPNKK